MLQIWRVQIIPKLVGAHGSQVTLQFRRVTSSLGQKTVTSTFDVVLNRGRKATFRDNADEATPLQLDARNNGGMKLIVPAGAKPGDLIKGQGRGKKAAMVRNRSLTAHPPTLIGQSWQVSRLNLSNGAI